MDLESEHRDLEHQQKNDSCFEPLAAQVPPIIGDPIVRALVQILECFETVRRHLQPRIDLRLCLKPEAGDRYHVRMYCTWSEQRSKGREQHLVYADSPQPPQL